MNDKTKNLFRKEVLEHRSNNFGNIIIIRPISFTFFIAGITFIVLLALIYLYFGSYNRIEHVQGVLKTVTGLSEIYGSEQGFINKVYISEGEYIEAGEYLYSIKTGRQSSNGDVDQIAASSIKKNLDVINEQISILKTKHKNEKVKLNVNRKELKNDVIHLKNKLKLEEKKYSLSKQKLDSYQVLYQKGLVSKIKLNDMSREIIQHEITIDSIKSKLYSKNLKLNQYATYISDLVVSHNLEVNKLKEKYISLEKELIGVESKSSYIVKAPISGLVSTPVLKVGESVQTEYPILTILPDDLTLEAELYIPSRAIGFVTVGQTVMLKYASYPYQKFGMSKGKISKVSKNIIHPENLKYSSSVKEPVYRVFVKLNSQFVSAFDKQYPLQVGMSLVADIIGEPRSLLEWIFSPLS
ncbi:HlyD family secretion protein [Spartinivicinus poritis]|uniref:HlyD family efflux transporter periplasmic adaptor subunit n=1 Tax=Spartinivicinus poritis TaxID=2994640 RepID=A0ABT5UFS8_9GAMM|nr:HlyD family efflux transporter periplasmic adaptor subunit [Spartinivicinus sp. A2-2]MDE1465045.1 HlyD family efflux transporter periplasmic adaptor subunit [Spartinivicinus sp. A2-2]